jgi:hypothetical protein
MAKQPIEIFMPPNMLKAKLGGTVVGLDMAAVKRAEAAVESLKSEFGAWIGADVARLVECRDAFAKHGGSAAHRELFRASHDLKGQALTCDFPLVARIAASLCHLLEQTETAPLSLVDAHVDGARAILRDDIRDAANPTASALAKELEARVIETAGA